MQKTEPVPKQNLVYKEHSFLIDYVNFRMNCVAPIA